MVCADSSGSSGSIAPAEIVTSTSSPCPLTTTFTSPPPALPSTSASASSCCAVRSWLCICCAAASSCCISNWPLGSTFCPIAHSLSVPVVSEPTACRRHRGTPRGAGSSRTFPERNGPACPGPSGVTEFLDDVAAQGALDQVDPGERGDGRVVVGFLGGRGRGAVRPAGPAGIPARSPLARPRAGRGTRAGTGPGGSAPARIPGTAPAGPGLPGRSSPGAGAFLASAASAGRAGPIPAGPIPADTGRASTGRTARAGSGPSLARGRGDRLDPGADAEHLLQDL